MKHFARWGGLLAAWLALFWLFAQQQGWEKVLRGLFPTVATPIYERQTLLGLVLEHLGLALATLGLVLLVGLPLVVFVTRRVGLAFLPLVSSMVTLGQTLPPVAALFLALPVFGFGAQTAVLALFLYGMLPTVRGGLLGFQGIPEPVLEAAKGMGMSGGQRFWRIELPLALPALLTGIRITFVLTLATATLTPMVGTGGLGVPIIAGLSTDNLALVLEGALPVALLTLLSDQTLRQLEHTFVR